MIAVEVFLMQLHAENSIRANAECGEHLAYAGKFAEQSAWADRQEAGTLYRGNGAKIRSFLVGAQGSAVAVFHKKNVEVETWVSCSTCSWEIPVSCKTRLPLEYSVPCPNCGRRHVYQSLEGHGRNTDAEATERVRRRPFSAGKEETIRRKSWLGELRSLLVH